ncbi:hypothetical protein H0H87_000103 [Tephrocybe sp. NHM501043]|nr:hypothetical protein H0H87_000103 [Tephrocybe sp. NHM501043]
MPGSEYQPLLPSTSTYLKDDTPTCREKTAEFLESRRLHTIVILLIIIDAACVLADLSYTVLSPECGDAAGELPSWLEVLSHISLAITSLFMIEIPLAIWAFGLSFYNPASDVIHSGLHLFDALIIVVTFVLEVALKGRERELAGLLITLRLWRLVKLVGGVAVGAGEIEEETARRLAETLDELRNVKTDLSVAQSENHELRQRLALFQVQG